MKIGAQLFTVRKFTQDLNSFSETLKKVADIGYTTVQVSGTCEYDAAWLREELRKNGLTCAITHNSMDKLVSDTLSVAEANKAINCHYVGIGTMPDNETLAQRYSSFVKKYKPVAQTIKQQGLYFMYHHHSFEFEKVEGKRVINMLADVFSAEEMGFTLDTYWVQAGGADPAQWIRDLAGRVPCVHLKDMGINNAQQIMTPIGCGNINFDKIIAACEFAKTEYVLVEQDKCYEEDPFVCLRKSYEALSAMGLT